MRYSENFQGLFSCQTQVTFLQQFCVTLGWGRGSTLLNCVFQFSGVPFAVMFGVLLFNERLSLSAIFGMAVLLASELVAVLIMQKKPHSVNGKK